MRGANNLALAEVFTVQPLLQNLETIVINMPLLRSNEGKASFYLEHLDLFEYDSLMDKIDWDDSDRELLRGMTQETNAFALKWLVIRAVHVMQQHCLSLINVCCENTDSRDRVSSAVFMKKPVHEIAALRRLANEFWITRGVSH
jgi:hypothetical protein